MRYGNSENSIIIDGNKSIPVNMDNADYRQIVEDGTVIDPCPGDPPLPTNDEIYDQVIQNQKVFKALALVCADQFGMTPAQMKAAIKAEM